VETDPLRSPEAYARRIAEAGFDGVYLNLVDAYQFFEDAESG